MHDKESRTARATNGEGYASDDPATAAEKELGDALSHMTLETGPADKESSPANNAKKNEDLLVVQADGDEHQTSGSETNKTIVNRASRMV